MIKIKGLRKSYGKKIALDNEDLHVRKGEIFGFLGPNGAGKTTTIKILTGLIQKDQGEVFINGLSIEEDMQKCKEIMSFVPDTPEIYNNITGIRYLNFLSDIYKVSSQKRKERILKYSEIFDIKKDLNSFVDSYSHGMKQKLILIGALIHEPKLLILDEPMVGLDPKSSFKLKEIMNEICSKGGTVFFSTHVLEVAEKLCHRIGIINKGKIISTGKYSELRSDSNESLEEFFLGLTNETV